MAGHPLPGFLFKIRLTQGGAAVSNGDDGRGFFEDFGVWQHAPVLTGSTKFEPLPDVKNIMVTGGAGFMCCLPVPRAGAQSRS